MTVYWSNLPPAAWLTILDFFYWYKLSITLVSYSVILPKDTVSYELLP